MAASNEQIWAASALNMGAKEFSQQWHDMFRQYVAPGVTFEAWSRDANELKSRYADVKCNDQTRVILKDRQGDADFIHANWVGPATPGGTTYICAQGPLDETTHDFWHMVHSEGASVIVMLSPYSKDSDASFEMCARYFPQRVGESLAVGDYTVTCVKFLDGPAAVPAQYRQLVVTRRGSGQQLEVAHAHATYWKDHSAPPETAPTLALRRWVHEQHGGRPVVVHGSAGVGRSMTFCAIDMAIARVAADPTIDFIELTKELRAIRASGVESFTQVLFLICLTLDALVDDKKIVPYEDSHFVLQFRTVAQKRNARIMAEAMQGRRAQVAAAAE